MILNIKHKTFSKDYMYCIIAFFIVAITLIPLFILCKYNHPQSLDNFRGLTAFATGREAILNSLHNIRLFHRHTIFFYNCLWLIPKTTSIECYDLIVLIHRIHAFFIICFFAAALFHLLKAINTFYIKAPSSLLFLCYSLYLFIIIQSLTRIDFFFYEMGTTPMYTLGLCFSLLFIAVLFKSYNTFSLKNVLKEIILLFFISGCIEYFIIFAGYILFMFLLSNFIYRKKIIIRYAVYLIILISIFLYLFTRPGNANKIQGYSGGLSNPYSLDRFVWWNKNFIDNFLLIISRMTNLLPLIFIVFTAFVFSTVYKIKHSFFVLLIILFNYCLGYIIGLSTFITGIINLEWAPAMIQIPNFIFVTNTITLFYVIVNILYHSFEIKDISENHIFTTIKTFIHFHNYITIAFSSLLILLFIFFSNPSPIRTAWADIIRGRAQSYDKQIMSLYDSIKESNDDIVIVKEIKPVPKTLITSDVTSNLWSLYGTYSYQKDYYTDALAPFFHKKDIIITE